MEPIIGAIVLYAASVVVFFLPVKKCSIYLCGGQSRNGAKTLPDEEAAGADDDDGEDPTTEQEKFYWSKMYGTWRLAVAEHIPNALKILGAALLLSGGNGMWAQSVSEGESSLPERNLLRLMSGLTVLVITLGGIMVLVACVDVMGDYFQQRAQKTARAVDDQVVSLARNSLKYGLVGLGLLTALENLSVDTTSLITISGVLSLSVAMGASDAVKNVFGLFTVVVDKPFTIGDHVKVAGAEGFVHRINLRHTTIKSFQNTLVHVPNTNFIGSSVENWSRQKEMKMKLTFVVTYQCPSDSLRELRKSLIAHVRSRSDTGDTVDVDMAFVPSGIELSWSFRFYKGEGACRKEGWAWFEDSRQLKMELLLFAKDEMARLGITFASFPVEVTGNATGAAAISASLG